MGELIGSVYSKDFTSNPNALGLIPRYSAISSAYSESRYFKLATSEGSQFVGIFDIVCFKDHASDYSYKKIHILVRPKISTPTTVANVMQSEGNQDFSLYYTCINNIVTLYLEAPSQYYCAGMQSFVLPGNTKGRFIDCVTTSVPSLPSEAISLL